MYVVPTSARPGGVDVKWMVWERGAGGRTVNACSACAGRYVESPACLATIVQAPAEESETVDPVTVHAPSAEKPTANPELALADTAYVPPTCAGDGGLEVKEIDWTLR
jgi:hypothetical protein